MCIRDRPTTHDLRRMSRDDPIDSVAEETAKLVAALTSLTLSRQRAAGPPPAAAATPGGPPAGTDPPDMPAGSLPADPQLPLDLPPQTHPSGLQDGDGASPDEGSAAEGSAPPPHDHATCPTCG